MLLQIKSKQNEGNDFFERNEFDVAVEKYQEACR